MAEELFKLPIRACDIFRILSTRTVAEHHDLLKVLSGDGFIEKFLENIERSERISVKKGKGFLNYREGHPWRREPKEWSKMKEENLCRCEMGFKSYESSPLGKLIDYQIPLNSSLDSAEGKVDLLSQNDDAETIYVIEAKGIHSNEHPLRAMFEALTFWRMMADFPEVKLQNAASFVNAYNAAIKEGCDKCGWQRTSESSLKPEYTLKPAILLCWNSGIWMQLVNDELTDCNLKRVYSELLKYIDCFEYYGEKGDLDGDLMIKPIDFPLNRFGGAR